MQVSQAMDLLRRSGIKATRQRELVVRTLASANSPMSVDHIHEQVRLEDATINLSTVYRVLEALQVKALVEQSRHPISGKLNYMLAAFGHSHHLTCINCGATVPMHSCPLAKMLGSLQDTHKFRITGHRLEVFGECADCQTHEE